MSWLPSKQLATIALVCFLGILLLLSKPEPRAAMTVLEKDRPVADTKKPPSGPQMKIRMGVEQLRNPFWYAKHGQDEESKRFWDKDHWKASLKQWASDGYNAILYWVEPWTETSWRDFFIRHKKYPEARVLTDKEADRAIAHLRWIFHHAHQLGLKNFLFDYQVTTNPAFAKAHGMDKEMPVSTSVDFRHNLKGQMGPAFGVRSKLTRAFTEAVIAELFETYKDLDGLDGGLGEALPGKRSSWYREAIAPGLKRSGRAPISIVMNWMLPLEDFLEDVAPKEVYDNTWLSVHANVEMLTDAKPYPMALRWAERGGKPVLFEIVHHNHEAGFPVNSPRLAHEIVREFRKVPNCKGYLAWFLRSDPNSLFRQALGFYGSRDQDYSDDPWVKVLEERFGDRAAAKHFLKAYDASARIPGEMSALAWLPHDTGTSRQLMLPYWYWTGQEPRWQEFVSPARAGVLLPVRHYARVVARLGKTYRDNSGADPAKNADHPGSQELIWGLGDYPITPEAHMRHIRQLGEECLREAEAALKTVKTNIGEAKATYNYMKAYKLLADYYERKVLAAVAALIYRFGRTPSAKAEAEKLADQAVEKYTTAIQFISESIDKRQGRITGRWDGKVFKLPELIEYEKNERKQLAKLFDWPAN
jgi:hypothetical protein